MGNKKTNNQSRVQQSMGQMVSRAALAQLGPEIENIVRHYVQNLGSQLATKQASVLETLFARVVVLETIVIEKLGYTGEQLTEKVSDIEDQKENLTLVDGPAEENDMVRIEVRTKTKDQAEFQGSSRIKIYKLGSGQTIGPELEAPLVGMKTGETKSIEFGQDKNMVAEITINRVSRVPAPVVLKEETDEGVVEMTAGIPAEVGEVENGPAQG